jgi:hypothetical protein
LSAVALAVDRLGRIKEIGVVPEALQQTRKIDA